MQKMPVDAQIVALVEDLAEKVESFVASRHIDKFAVGLTGQPLADRERAYRSKKAGHWDFLVGLIDNLSDERALEIEAKLHERLRGHPKYHPFKSNRRHIRSLGGKKRAGRGGYLIYAAWWER